MPFNAWTDSSLITSNLERFLLGDSSPATPARSDRCRICQLHSFSQAPYPPFCWHLFHNFTSALLVSRMCGKYCDSKTTVKANNKENEARRANSHRREEVTLRPMRGEPLPGGHAPATRRGAASTRPASDRTMRVTNAVKKAVGSRSLGRLLRSPVTLGASAVPPRLRSGETTAC